MPDLCPPCTTGSHTACEIWNCACAHRGCPDQLTIDDALSTEETP